MLGYRTWHWKNKDLERANDGIMLYWKRCRAQEEEEEEMSPDECLVQWKKICKEGEKPWEEPSSVHITVDLLEAF